jgi:hypothetical protein
MSHDDELRWGQRLQQLLLEDILGVEEVWRHFDVPSQTLDIFKRVPRHLYLYGVRFNEKDATIKRL